MRFPLLRPQQREFLNEHLSHTRKGFFSTQSLATFVNTRLIPGARVAPPRCGQPAGTRGAVEHWNAGTPERTPCRRRDARDRATVPPFQRTTVQPAGGAPSGPPLRVGARRFIARESFHRLSNILCGKKC